MKTTFAIALLFALAAPVASSAQSRAERFDATAAAELFAEAGALCASDDGRLWGVDLLGPILLVDTKAKRLWASHQDDAKRLVQNGAVYEGALPSDLAVANTAVEWGGVRWTMIVLPLPADASARRRLVAHELFHRAQTKLGLPLASPANAHLDSSEGRVLMRLEWRALRRALSSANGERASAVEDLLAFRAQRRELSTEAAREERALELNEGLAEYTGLALGVASIEERVAAAIAALEAADAGKSFSRSFAYASGPAYGLLLDASKPAWRRAVRADDDLGELLRVAYGLRDGMASRDARREARYDGGEIRRDETARETARRERERALRAALVDGPTLTLTFTPAMRISFDPNALETLPGAGTVYPTAVVVDAWGRLDVTDGALVDGGWRSIAVAAPAKIEGTTIESSAWRLELADGWEIVRDAATGKLVAREAASK